MSVTSDDMPTMAKMMGSMGVSGKGSVRKGRPMKLSDMGGAEASGMMQAAGGRPKKAAKAAKASGGRRRGRK